MTPRFLIDAQLPPALAERLASVGFEASHVNRIGLGAASDLAIWRRAPALADALITKDIDFVQLARSDAAGVAVIWIRIGNVTNAALWRVLEPALPEIVAALRAGERIVEIR